ncbi:branched-chain amino acid ABC transporter permease [Ornithinimicrobium faecis]|uniref:Branched-chain amino acid ABC transporter permease n=1 Tax=Ornithinimicrobium faecis TaxID=2934158 RepID=A0ABY4YQT7_9MICO|nr:branched-chain amino acid ABC transporter permease [Ornithinimicrobium sp. HY1793]USQ78979.1 branched-chain amino acid ABC transporter permease [Ornithinimicrobium sp. HY1793]
MSAVTQGAAAPAPDRSHGPSRRPLPIRQSLVVGLVVLVLLMVPWVFDAFTVSTFTRALVFAVLAMAVNLLTGIAGMPTLGQAAYFGVGAYTGALVSIHWSELGVIQLLLATLAGVVAALLTGPLAIRGRGVAFLMITLAIGEIGYSAAGRLDWVTGGTDGLSGILPVVLLPGGEGLVNEGLIYYYVLVVAALAYVGVGVLLRSPFGLTLRGLRDNEARLRAVGYRTNTYALGVYVCAGGLAALAGSLWTSSQRFVAPGDMGFDIAALALLAVIVGGVGSMWGACLGAAVVVFTRDYFGQIISGHAPLLLGILFVLAVYLLPKGIAGGRAQWRSLFPRSRAETTPEEAT